MNLSYVYLLVDEIDHITIRYREQNKPLSRKEAVEKLRYVYYAFEAVKAAFPDTDMTSYALHSLSDDELHTLLVRARTVLLRDVVVSRSI